MSRTGRSFAGGDGQPTLRGSSRLRSVRSSPYQYLNQYDPFTQPRTESRQRTLELSPRSPAPSDRPLPTDSGAGSPNSPTSTPLRFHVAVEERKLIEPRGPRGRVRSSWAKRRKPPSPQGMGAGTRARWRCGESNPGPEALRMRLSLPSTPITPGASTYTLLESRHNDNLKSRFVRISLRLR